MRYIALASRIAVLSVFALGTSGCYASVHVKCKGKGIISVNALMYGGTITGDCGEGFEYSRESEKYNPTSEIPVAPK